MKRSHDPERPPRRCSRAGSHERKRDASLDQTILDLLRPGLGVGSRVRSNGLAAFAGTWSKEDLARFEKATAVFEHVDEDAWS